MHSSFFLTSRLHRLIVLCIFLVHTLPASAQEKAGEELETIAVIGSHIKMDPEDAAVPITSIDREDLRYQGSPSVMTRPAASGLGMPGIAWAGYSVVPSARTARCGPNR